MLSIAFIFILGLVIGSFLTAYSWRVVEGVSIARGRSMCPRCKITIAWYDNIPVLSYFLLGGKCRNCRKSIPIRYPIIEISTALLFLGTYLFSPVIISNITWLERLPIVLSIAYLLLVVSVMVAVFITDAEHQIIPDEAVFFGLSLTLIMLIASSDFFYSHVFAGFAAAAFLLIINLATLGRGMGLGDVKLAIFAGAVLGPINSAVWLFLAFLLGSIVGISLIVAGRQKLGNKIAFGPFLVAAFFIVLVKGDKIISTLLPYI